MFEYPIRVRQLDVTVTSEVPLEPDRIDELLRINFGDVYDTFDGGKLESYPDGIDWEVVE